MMTKSAPTGRTVLLLVALAGPLWLAIGCSSPPAPPAPPPQSPPQSQPPAAAATTSSPAPGPTLQQQDQRFLTALKQRSIAGPGAADGRQYALAICARLDANASVDEMVIDVRGDTGLNLNDTGYVIGVATGVYCPRNVSKLPVN